MFGTRAVCRVCRGTNQQMTITENCRKILDFRALDASHPIKQFIKFGLVGVVGVSINYGLFFVLYKLGVQAVIASPAGFFGAGIVVFLANRSWTFKGHDKAMWRQAVMFFCMLLVSGSADMAVMYFTVHILAIHPLIAKVFALATTISMNFAISRFWVFKPAAPQE